MIGVSETNVDTAGGIIRPLQTEVTLDNGSGDNPLTIIGCPVDPHPPCPDPAIHCAAHMVEGEPTITINGIPVSFLGHRADCGHPTTGQADFGLEG